MSHHSTHRTLFQHYIRAGVQESLARVQAVEHLVPEVDRQQAWHLLSFALDVPEVWDETRALLLALAPKMEQAGFRQAWMVYLKEGLRSSLNMKDRHTAAECHLQMGVLYHLTGQYQNASTHITESIALFAATHDKQRHAYALCELAWVEQRQSNFREARDHVEDAFLLLLPEDPELGLCYRILGMIAYGLREWQESERYHRQSIVEFDRNGDRRRSAWGWQNAGIALMEQGRHAEAIEHFDHSLKILAPLGDIHRQAVIHVNIANALYRSNQYRYVIDTLVKAEQILKMTSDVENLARVYTLWGLADDKMDQFLESENMFLAAVKCYQMIGDIAEEINVLDALAKTYLHQHKTSDAILELEQAYAKLTTIPTHPLFHTLYTFIEQDLKDAWSNQEAILVTS